MSDSSPLCACGHAVGDHYAKPGWPACSQCTDCRKIQEMGEQFKKGFNAWLTWKKSSEAAMNPKPDQYVLPFYPVDTWSPGTPQHARWKLGWETAERLHPIEMKQEKGNEMSEVP